MKYCVSVLYEQKGGKAGNLSETQKNEQTRRYKSYVLSLSSTSSRNNIQTTWNTGKNTGFNSTTY